ncbi:MAG: dienelactone hydrolase family protein [Fimbriimonadaceae bacterium]|nr:dienelactone hydrolase family protein [Fimbriimonadaceae bacterium]
MSRAVVLNGAGGLNCVNPVGLSGNNAGMITFDGNGNSYGGYLAIPESGTGPALIVIQEWWGIVGHIKSVTDRFAQAGFVALAPDFYHGKATTEPDEAGSLMMALNIADAEKVLKGAVNFLLSHEAVTSNKAGVVGFCMGGQLSLYAATVNSKIGACVDFYGIHPNVHPQLENLNCPMLGIFAENDAYSSPEVVSNLSAKLNELGKPHEFVTYPGTQHAFFNDDRPEVYDAAASADAWNRTVKFLGQHLNGK